MNKFQKLQFKSVGDFLDYLPEEELVIVETLRSIILASIPDCKEKLSYNVPFYYRHYRICYIWPASVPWGGFKEGVSLGFCRANEMTIDGDYLQFNNKKVVASRKFLSPKDIDVEKVSQFLYEAVIADEEAAKKKKPTR